MTVLEIEAFLAIIRTRNLSLAANEIHTAPSTISHRLKSLEQKFGTILIERGKGVKEIRLTPAGEQFVPIAERLESLLREAQILQKIGPKLTLSIGNVSSLNTCSFPPLYRLLTANHPQLTLNIRTQHSIELYDEVDRQQLDVAFVLIERSLPNINVEVLFSKPMVVLRATDPNGKTASSVHPSELDPKYELFISWSPTFQTWHDNWWDPLRPSRIIIDQFTLIFSLLQDPRQWAIVPLWVAQEGLKRGNLAISRLTPPPPNITCYKITHKYPRSGTLASLKTLNHYLELFLQTENQI
jgi:DNA-binding transcriptional LysR family regulator